MTGDGTNDAPALAQADVGVAMNTGTMAAKEAGNMVDLDSNPTKLIEIVAIGKQLLITRGALTTFSIANDVAKYFAIIPAMFMTTYPALAALNIMRLHTPQSAILAAVIFQRAHHHRAGAAGAARREIPAAERRGDAAAQPADLRRRRHHRAVPGHLGDRSTARPAAPGLRFNMWSYFAPAFKFGLVFLSLTGLPFSGLVTALAQVFFPKRPRPPSFG